MRRCDLALAFRAAGRVDEAIASYRRALEILPTYDRAHSELAETLLAAGRSDEARPHLVAAQTTAPTVEPVAIIDIPTEDDAAEMVIANADAAHRDVQACHELVARGRWDQALTRLRTLIHEHPESSEAALLLAELALQDQDYETAVDVLKSSMARQGTSIGYYRLGEAYEGIQRRHDALIAFAQATELDPYHLPSLIRAGSAALGVGRVELSEKFFRLATTLQPGVRELWNSLGTAVYEQGRRDEAVETYRRAIEVAGENPYPAAAANMALPLIHSGRLTEGWAAYRNRWECGANAPRRAEFGLPEWSGEALGERMLLIQSEQGLGDELMFGTCYRDALAIAPRAFVTCDYRLESLLARSFPDVRFLPVVRGDEEALKLPRGVEPIAQVAAGELPALFRTAPHDFASNGPYLRPDPELLAEWQARFDAVGAGPKIGIAWRGGQTEKDRALRSLTRAALVELLKLPGVTWINLQAGVDEDEFLALQTAAEAPLCDWPEFDLRDDLENLAARIAACDMVISVGNAVVHMAGAVGTPTRCLLPAHAGWRWGTAERPLAWYADVTVVRQSRAGDWTGPVRAIVEEWNASHTPTLVRCHTAPHGQKRHEATAAKTA
ncbi:MAG: tetratricopeptide repeat protein [Pirellulales bacterium]